MVGGIPGGHVVDDPITTFHAEVDVEIRQRHPLRVQEPLEQQVVLERVEIGDSQRVGDERSGPRAAPRSDRNPLLSRPSDEVRHDEEVPRVPHAADDVELPLQALPVLRLLAAGRLGALSRAFEPPPEPRPRALGEPLVEVVAVRDGKLGKMAAAELDRHGASARDLHRVLQGLGKVLEQRRHLLRRLQVLLFAVLPRTPRIGEDPAVVDAHPRFVRLEIVPFEKSHVVAGDDREPHRHCQIDRRLQARRILGASRALDAEVEAIREDGRPRPGPALRLPGAPVQQRTADVARRSGRYGDDSVRAFADPCTVGDGDGGAAVRHVAPGQEPGELPVARAVHREQRQHAIRGVARSAPDRQINADNRLDARRNRRAIEAHHAEQVRAIGDGDRRHAERLRALDERTDPGYPVDERELGMQVQVDESGIHERSRSGTLRTSADRTGAKLARWIGEGPNRSRASR